MKSSDINAPSVAPSSAVSEQDLAQFHLFKEVAMSAVVPLLREAPVRTLEAGQVLLRAGDPCAALYLVLAGALRLRGPSSGVPDAVAKVGDSVGELFLVPDARAPWTVSALESARLLCVDRQTANRLIDVSHAFARNFVSLLTQRLRIGNDIAGSDALKTAYQRHATLDEITGLHNKNWLDTMLPRQLLRSSMAKTPLGLLLVEIDGFADYRAQFGAVAADHARCAVAQTLIHSVRPTDLIACHGPAQFAIVLPDADLPGACTVGERVCAAVNEAVILMSDESILPSITVSVGAAEFEASMDAAVLLRAAENLVQAAKRTGGNRVCG